MSISFWMSGGTKGFPSRNLPASAKRLVKAHEIEQQRYPESQSGCPVVAPKSVPNRRTLMKSTAPGHGTGSGQIRGTLCGSDTQRETKLAPGHAGTPQWSLPLPEPRAAPYSGSWPINLGTERLGFEFCCRSSPVVKDVPIKGGPRQPSAALAIEQSAEFGRFHPDGAHQDKMRMRSAVTTPMRALCAAN